MKNIKRNPDYMFIKRVLTSAKNPIKTMFQWEAAYGMISLYSFKHKNRSEVLALEKIALEKKDKLFPKTHEEEPLTQFHKLTCGAK